MRCDAVRCVMCRRIQGELGWLRLRFPVRDDAQTTCGCGCCRAGEDVEPKVPKYLVVISGPGEVVVGEEKE